MLIRPRKIYEKIGEKRLKKSGNSSGGRPMYAQDFETQKDSPQHYIEKASVSVTGNVSQMGS